jgi:general secretion pathway protein L
MSARSRPGESPVPAARPRLRPVAPAGAAPAETGLGAGALALPTELAHILRVPLPLASHRQRQAAAGFAVEDLIAEPLDASHVVLGPELGPGEYLAVVVAQREMAVWAARATAGQRLVPDVLALPVPADGCCSVRETDGRVLVRRADGTGYATRSECLEAFWRADGAPQIVLYGGRLPDTLPIGAPGLMPPGPTAEAARFDLLQGAYARAGIGPRRVLARLGAVIVLALAGHSAIVGAETVALQHVAQDRETALRAALTARVPDLPASLPLSEAMLRAMPRAPEPAGGFLPLLARVSEVLGGTGDEITLRNLAWSAEDGLSLSVGAPDLATLQRIETDLRAGGLAVSPGVATTGGGGAEVQYVIRGGA